MQIKPIAAVFAVFTFFLSACAAQPAQIFSGKPQAYVTAAPSQIPAPNVIVILETPIPTSTPYNYTIQAGDTFSQLAERFKISQDELRAANPDIRPNSMPVGGTLLIPDISAPLAAAPTPSPESVPVSQINCHPSIDSGAWCFALIQNITPNVLENISAQINLLDENNQIVASQTAFAPLNIIPPGESLPAYVYFSNVPIFFQPQAQLLTAAAVDVNSTRYLPAQMNHIVTQINWRGDAAQVSGEIFLPPESKPANKIWIAAVAYDKDSRVIGLKRWEGGAMQAGTSQPFNFMLSALTSSIHHVEFILEAAP